MAFLMSFPLMFRSKVGEMKFSIPQSLLAERGEGAQGVPAMLSPSTTGQGRGRGGQRHPVASLTQILCYLHLPPGREQDGQCALLCRMAISTWFYRR